VLAEQLERLLFVRDVELSGPASNDETTRRGESPGRVARLDNQLLELGLMEGRDIQLHTSSHSAVGLFGRKQLAERVADRADERRGLDVGPQVAHEVEVEASS